MLRSTDFETAQQRACADISKMVTHSLHEDLGGSLDLSADITAQLIPKNMQSNARLITREAGVFCGRLWAEEVCQQLGNRLQIQWHVQDGDVLTADQVLCTLAGPARDLLTAERSMMNWIQTLSGCASIVAEYAKRLEGTDCRLLDTRKTVPGLRTALKYAVTCGGGFNHRVGVFDAYLIKENHIMACGGIQAAIAQAKQNHPHLAVEVETETLAELSEAIDAGADIIMLDNFSHDMMQQAITINAGRAALEASGNITLDSIASYAQTGIDYISVGALTKHIRALDLSLRFSDAQ